MPIHPSINLLICKINNILRKLLLKKQSPIKSKSNKLHVLLKQIKPYKFNIRNICKRIKLIYSQVTAKATYSLLACFKQYLRQRSDSKLFIQSFKQFLLFFSIVKFNFHFKPLKYLFTISLCVKAKFILEISLLENHLDSETSQFLFNSPIVSILKTKTSACNFNLLSISSCTKRNFTLPDFNPVSSNNSLLAASIFFSHFFMPPPGKHHLPPSTSKVDLLVNKILPFLTTMHATADCIPNSQINALIISLPPKA